jgi:hypothetical protein
MGQKIRLTLGWLLLLGFAGCAASQTAAPVAATQQDCERAGGIWRGERAYCERAGGGGY